MSKDKDKNEDKLVENVIQAGVMTGFRLVRQFITNVKLISPVVADEDFRIELEFCDNSILPSGLINSPFEDKILPYLYTEVKTHLSTQIKDTEVNLLIGSVIADCGLTMYNISIADYIEEGIEETSDQCWIADYYEAIESVKIRVNKKDGPTVIEVTFIDNSITHIQADMEVQYDYVLDTLFCGQKLILQYDDLEVYIRAKTQAKISSIADFFRIVVETSIGNVYHE